MNKPKVVMCSAYGRCTYFMSSSSAWLHRTPTIMYAFMRGTWMFGAHNNSMNCCNPMMCHAISCCISLTNIYQGRGIRRSGPTTTAILPEKTTLQQVHNSLNLRIELLFILQLQVFTQTSLRNQRDAGMAA